MWDTFKETKRKIVLGEIFEQKTMDILSCSQKIVRMVSFDFIYELLVAYYSAVAAWLSILWVLFKILPAGYLYGIQSERQLVRGLRLNIAHRWFCGFEPEGTISLYSVGIPIHENTLRPQVYPKVSHCRTQQRMTLRRFNRNVFPYDSFRYCCTS